MSRNRRSRPEDEEQYNESFADQLADALDPTLEQYSYTGQTFQQGYEAAGPSTGVAAVNPDPSH